MILFGSFKTIEDQLKLRKIFYAHPFTGWILHVSRTNINITRTFLHLDKVIFDPLLEFLSLQQKSVGFHQLFCTIDVTLKVIKCFIMIAKKLSCYSLPNCIPMLHEFNESFLECNAVCSLQHGKIILCEKKNWRMVRHDTIWTVHMRLFGPGYNCNSLILNPGFYMILFGPWYNSAPGYYSAISVSIQLTYLTGSNSNWKGCAALLCQNTLVWLFSSFIANRLTFSIMKHYLSRSVTSNGQYIYCCYHCVVGSEWLRGNRWINEG